MCFAYLIHLGGLYSDGSHIPKDVFRQFPLLHYVATFWASHLHRLEKKPRSTRLDDLSLRFFSGSAPPSQFWLNFMGFSYRGDGRLLRKLDYLQGVNIHSIFSFEWPNSYSSPSNNGFTSTVDPLSWMTVFPLDDQIQLCLDNGLSNRVSSPERYLGTPMYAAAAFGHLSTIKIFLQKGMKVEDSKGPQGTALHVASYNGNQSVVQLYVESGADVNVHCNGLTSPLTIAASHKDKSIFYYLLDHGADPNVPCPLGERLLNRFIREEPFNEKIVLRLLASGADIEARGIHSTPLQEAINFGTEPIVRFLLKHGANPNSGGEPYGGPLEAAARNGHRRIISLLLESGADVNGEGKLKENKKYKSPLEYAVDHVRPAIVRLLLREGAGRDRSRFDNIYTQVRRRLEGFILRTESEAPSKWLSDKLNGSQADKLLFPPRYSECSQRYTSHTTLFL
jgi:ankyrin repeat protein